ncbi:MAG: RluA family pseudouridine synthase [Saprospiraceae bacterium]|nr:RluA family pseudouridine synthase [Saprospiraceae bacterium]
MIPIQKQLLFENDHLIAINKPAGLLSIPDRFDKNLPCAYQWVKENFGELFILHRLDKDTSGVLLFAKDAETHKLMNEQFERHQVKKTYLCLIESCPQEESGKIIAPIAHDPAHPGRMIVHPKGKACITNFKLLKRYRSFTWVEVAPETGRTHQIRVHFAYLGCPLVGDPLYGIRKYLSIKDIKKKAKVKEEEIPSTLLERTALHASGLQFNLYGYEIEIQAPLPKDLTACLKQLDKWDSLNKGML